MLGDRDVPDVAEVAADHLRGISVSISASNNNRCLLRMAFTRKYFFLALLKKGSCRSCAAVGLQ